jgi:hypothetical protein
MKKAIVLLLALVSLGALFAQDAAAPELTLEGVAADVTALKAKPALAVSGSVEFGISGKKDNVWNFSSTKTATVTGSSTLSVDSDKVAATVVVGLTPTVAKTSGAALYKTDGRNYEFTQLDELIAYYKYGVAHYGFAAITNFETTLALNASLYTGTGSTMALKDADEVTWTVALWNNARSAFDSLTTTTKAQIQAISIAAVTYDCEIDQYGRLINTDNVVVDVAQGPLTGTDLTNAKKEIEAYDLYQDYVLGETSDDTWAASYPVKSASLKLKKLFGAVDLTFAVSGKAVGVGSMVTSIPAAQDISDETPLGLSLDLADGLVPGVSAGVLLNSFTAKQVSEDSATAVVEADTVDHVYGFAAYGGYKAAGEDMSYGANVYFGGKDASKFGDTYVLGLSVNFGMKSLAGLAVNGELDMLAGGGMAYAGKVGASIMGIAPSVAYYSKNADFGGNDSWDGLDSTKDSVTGDAGLMTEFNSTDAVDASALAIAVSVATKDLIGLDLATVSGGYDMLMSGSKNSGWNAGVSFALAGLIQQPLTLGVTASSWKGTEDGAMAYSANIGYTYDKLAITATYGVAADETTTYSILGKVTF